MIKKCLGCGITLQNQSPYTLGYTPDINNDYCERCFKITHYNAKIDVDLKINNSQLIKKITKNNYLVIFLVDFLNIYDEVIDTFKKISNEKILVITKSDLIPKNIIKNKFINNLRKNYDLKEDIFWCSTKNNENLNFLRQIIDNKSRVLFAGFTNSGKSSLINHLIGAKITVSKNANTTLDFIKLKYNDSIIYDVPGFIPSSFIDGMNPKSIIKPLTYQLKKAYFLQFLNIKLKCNIDNNLTLYLNNELKVEKRKVKEEFNQYINIPANSDLILKGLGFINIKKECIININIDLCLIEIRPSVVGG